MTDSRLVRAGDIKTSVSRLQGCIGFGKRLDVCSADSFVKELPLPRQGSTNSRRTRFLIVIEIFLISNETDSFRVPFFVLR